MKVTSKQLLNLFGLKVGDKIKFGENSVIFDVVESGYGIALRRKYVVGEIPITMFLNREFEIIKSKPKLNAYDKIFLKILNLDIYKECKKIKNSLLLYNHEIDFNSPQSEIKLANDTLLDLKEYELYNIKELLEQ